MRFFDILFSLLGIVFLIPLFLLFTLIIKLESKGNAFFKQIRVGEKGKHFNLLKFRTMIINAEKSGLQLTIGKKDNRITKVGYFLRKYKLDELPQLINVLKGDMSIVGPRPEVPKYVNLYTEKQRKVLNEKPGITDYASIEFINENEILAKAENPEQIYINEIMPDKIRFNLKYIENKSLKEYFKIIFYTIYQIFKK